MQVKIEEINEKNWFCLQLQKNLIKEHNVPLVINSQTDYKLPFLQNLKNIEGLKYCLLVNNIIAVKYNDNFDKELIKMLVMVEIDDFLQKPDIFVTEKNQAAVSDTIETIADTFIRPTLYRDKGDIILHSFENGILKLQFIGHCAGCPYAKNTLNNVIISTLQKYIPQLKSVILQE